MGKIFLLHFSWIVFELSIWRLDIYKLLMNKGLLNEKILSHLKIFEKENNEILFLKRLSYHNMEYLSIIPLKGKLKSRAIFKCVLGFLHECCTLNFSYSNWIYENIKLCYILSHWHHFPKGAIKISWKEPWEFTTNIRMFYFPGRLQSWALGQSRLFQT